MTYSKFLLHRILARHGAPALEMYTDAQTLLSAVLVISNQRNRVVLLSRDFSWVVRRYYYASRPRLHFSVTLLWPCTYCDDNFLRAR
jgi:hypothetical protein